jgi:Caspase domain/Sel1 repeat
MAARLREAGRGLAIGWLLLAMLLGLAGPAHAEQRLALIIANEAYVSPSLGRLPGTRTDAERMNAALTKAGFTVRTVSNAQKAVMQRAIGDFVSDLAKAGQDGVGFLYYTGHGIADARRGANYLIPVEADIGSTAELPLYALPMDDVLDAIEGAGAKAAFVVFDACRSTPTSLSRGSKGLLPSRGRTDTLVAFATAPGETAEDDGLYSRVLADHLTRAGANSTTLFAEVQSDVARESGRRQVPQFLSSLVDAVQFVVEVNPPVPPAPPGGTTETLPPQPSKVSDPYARWNLTAQDFNLADDKLVLDRAGVSYRFDEIKRAAEAGDSVAQTLMGLASYYGAGTNKDYSESLRWYRKAADLGEPVAINDVGFFYDNGLGVPQDYAEAMRWYRMAADLGVPPAKFNIGVHYKDGLGVPQDHAEAMRWYRKAADLGDSAAMHGIGTLFYYGEGVSQDYAEARRWFEKSAALGDEDAKIFLDLLTKAGH